MEPEVRGQKSEVGGNTSDSPILSLISVTKRYHHKDEAPIDAVDTASLTIIEGEIVAIRGPSGCGKTTLLLAAGSLLRPTSGKISFGGTDLYSLSPNERARLRAGNIGFVFQQFHLIPYLTVRDNILAAAMAMPSDDAAQHANALLSQFNLQGRAAHLPEELSTGERQRTALARALLNRPKLILADEPTGNLDEMNASVVRDALSDFAEAGGAVLLVTHDDRASGHAHRTLTMSAGQIL